jgi:polysaccharide biosynthesis transport protein
MAENNVVGSRPLRGLAMPSDPSAPTAMTPKDVFGIISRHMILIVFMTILGSCFGGAAWYGLTRYLPSFRAETLVAVRSPVEEDPTKITTTPVHKDLKYGHRVSLASLLKQPSMYNTLLLDDTVRGTSWFRSFDGDTNGPIRYLKKYLGAYAHRDADFVAISMTCGKANEAAAIANAMAELFVKSQTDQKKGEISEKLVQYQERRKQLAQDIDRIKKSLDDVRLKWDVADVSSEGGAYRHQHPVIANFNKLQQEENDLNLQVSTMRANMENIKALATGDISEQISHAIERDPVIIALTTQCNIQEANLSSKLATFGENHRLVKEFNGLVEDLKAKLEARTIEIAEQTRQANYKNARDYLVTLQSGLERIRSLREEASKQKDDLDLARVEHDRLKTTLDERQALLNTVKQQVEMWRIKLDDPSTPKVQLKARALPPIEMTASRHPVLWFPAGTLLGLVLGVALTFAIELLNDLVRRPSDVAKYLGIPLLGIIPDDGEDNLPRDVDLFQVVRQAPHCLLTESYRRLRANLELSGAKTLLIASGDSEDGRTSVAVNLAMTFAAKNKKVVIIDANFRQPDIQRVFPRQKQGDVPAAQYGLSNLLMGQCNIRQALRSSGIKGLDVIDTGLLPPNPSELLAGPLMPLLLKELSKAYHHVILDSPPALLVSDAQVLARRVDATVVVCNAAYTHRGVAQRVLYELTKVRANVAGCVLLGARSLRGGYFRKQHKAYRRYMESA